MPLSAGCRNFLLGFTFVDQHTAALTVTFRPDQLALFVPRQRVQEQWTSGDQQVRPTDARSVTAGGHYRYRSVLVAPGVVSLLAQMAFAMITAARTLVQLQYMDVPDKDDVIVNEFRARYVDTQIFWDKYHGDQFSRYLFARHEGPDTRFTADTVHKLVEEANLFIDAAHKAHAKWQEQQQAVLAGVKA